MFYRQFRPIALIVISFSQTNSNSAFCCCYNRTRLKGLFCLSKLMKNVWNKLVPISWRVLLTVSHIQSWINLWTNQSFCAFSELLCFLRGFVLSQRFYALSQILQRHACAYISRYSRQGSFLILSSIVHLTRSSTIVILLFISNKRWLNPTVSSTYLGIQQSGCGRLLFIIII